MALMLELVLVTLTVSPGSIDCTVSGATRAPTHNVLRINTSRAPVVAQAMA